MHDDWPQVYRQLASLVPNPRQFYIDYMDVTKTFEARHERSDSDAKLIDLTIDGDFAHGLVEAEFPANLLGPSRIEFQRIDGKWYVHTADLTRKQLRERFGPDQVKE